MKQFFFGMLLCCAIYGGWIVWKEVQTTSDVLDLTSAQLMTVTVHARPESEKELFTGDLWQFAHEKADMIISGIPYEEYQWVTPELEKTIRDIVAQFAQNTLNEKLVTIFSNSMTWNLLLIELIWERWYKNDLYVIDTTNQHILWTKTNKVQNKKAMWFIGNYILFHDWCIAWCTIPLNVIIQNRRSWKQLELWSVGEVKLYTALSSVGYKTYQKSWQYYDSQEQCPQPQCCDSEGKNCKIPSAVISLTQKVKKLP